MKKLLSLIVAILVFALSFGMVGCGGNDSSIDGTVLRICNCEDYIDEELLTEFEEETGITVQYSTYGTNENLYNELVINPNSYDLVVPSEYMIQKLATEGRIQKLDQTKLTGYNEKLSGFIKEKLDAIQFTVKDGVDKGQEVSLSEYLVGYMWGTMGWVYNTDNVDASDVKSWHGVFENPDLNKKMTIKDSVRDSYLVGLAMVYEEELRAANTNEKITEILNRVDSDAISKVGKMINGVKHQLYGFEVDSGKNDIVLGNIDAYVAWSGDAAYAIDVAAGEVEDDDGTFVENTRNLSYYIPDEGSNIWFDGLCMPSGSTNYDAVYKFLEFISREENVIRNMDYIGYTSVLGGDQLFDEIVLGWFDESEDLEDGEGITVDLSYYFGQGDYSVVVSEDGYGRLMAQYPTKEIADRCAIMSFFPNEALMEINDMWEQVKGETFPVWVLILTAVLVVLISVSLVLARNKEKLSWIRLPQRKSYAERKGLTLIKSEDVSNN